MHLTLHLTTGCNMRCSYCYSPPHDGPAMSMDVARQALQLGSRLTRGSCGIVFFGGEPLLRKDLIAEIVDYGRQLERSRAGRFHFKVTTNGVLLDHEFLDFAVRHNVLIAMSLDGIREAHDRHRRFSNGEPTFDYLRPRLELLLAARPYSSVLMVVNPDTAGCLGESVSFLVGLGCRYIIASLNYAAPWSKSDFAALRRQLEDLGALYARWTQEGRKFYLSPFEVKISSHVNRHSFRKERCELGARQLSVDAAGFLFPCVQFVSAGAGSPWCIGSVDAGLDEERRQSLRRESQADKPACLSCAIRDRCNNSCGCLNWQTTGCLNEVSPVLCQYERTLMPIADRVAERLYQKRDPLFLHKHYNAAYPALSLLEDSL